MRTHVRAVDQKGTYTPISSYQSILLTVPEAHSQALTALAPQCHAFRPANAPELFQVDTTDTTATVYFSPVRLNSNGYYIRYGTNPSNLNHGYGIQYSDSSGVIVQKVHHLQPKTTYYFQVRAGNGCMPGDWGNVLKATTASKNTLLKFFLYFKSPF